MRGHKAERRAAPPGARVGGPAAEPPAAPLRARVRRPAGRLRARRSRAPHGVDARAAEAPRGRARLGPSPAHAPGSRARGRGARRCARSRPACVPAAPQPRKGWAARLGWSEGLPGLTCVKVVPLCSPRQLWEDPRPRAVKGKAARGRLHRRSPTASPSLAKFTLPPELEALLPPAKGQGPRLTLLGSPVSSPVQNPE